MRERVVSVRCLPRSTLTQNGPLRRLSCVERAWIKGRNGSRNLHRDSEIPTGARKGGQGSKEDVSEVCIREDDDLCRSGKCQLSMTSELQVALVLQRVRQRQDRTSTRLSKGAIEGIISIYDTTSTSLTVPTPTICLFAAALCEDPCTHRPYKSSINIHEIKTMLVYHSKNPIAPSVREPVKLNGKDQTPMDDGNYQQCNRMHVLQGTQITEKWR